uniref:Uncharacterized protein n=1 Tax=Helianthus annuus TaxID=4232 RepID=A0A251VC57_HELAN
MIVQVSSANRQRSPKAPQILGSNPSYPWDYPQFPPAAHDDPDIVHVFGTIPTSGADNLIVLAIPRILRIMVDVPYIRS